MEILNENPYTDNLKFYDKFCRLIDKKTPFILTSNTENTKSIKDLIKATKKIKIKYDYILATSGTTGSPKYVFSDITRNEKLCQLINEKQHLKACKSSIVLLPISYSYPFVNQFLMGYFHNINLLYHDHYKGLSQLKMQLMESENVMLCLTNAYVKILKPLLHSEDTFPNVKTINFAGGPFPNNEFELLKQKFPEANIYNNYGCTEALPRLAIKAVNKSSDSESFDLNLNGINIRCDRENRVVFKSAYECVGIYCDGNFVDTSEEKYLRTGDYGQIKNGKLFLSGRIPGFLNRYGNKIDMIKLSKNLRSIFEDYFIIEVGKDEDGEDYYNLYLSEELNYDVKDKLFELLKNHLRKFEWPIEVVSVRKIKYNANGKKSLSLTKSGRIDKIWKQRV